MYFKWKQRKSRQKE